VTPERKPAALDEKVEAHEPESNQDCKYWISPKHTCFHGDKCKFQHDPKKYRSVIEPARSTRPASAASTGTSNVTATGTNQATTTTTTTTIATNSVAPAKTILKAGIAQGSQPNFAAVVSKSLHPPVNSGSPHPTTNTAGHKDHKDAKVDSTTATKETAHNHVSTGDVSHPHATAGSQNHTHNVQHPTVKHATNVNHHNEVTHTTLAPPAKDHTPKSASWDAATNRVAIVRDYTGFHNGPLGWSRDNTTTPSGNPVIVNVQEVRASWSQSSGSVSDRDSRSSSEASNVSSLSSHSSHNSSDNVVPSLVQQRQLQLQMQWNNNMGVNHNHGHGVHNHSHAHAHAGHNHSHGGHTQQHHPGHTHALSADQATIVSSHLNPHASAFSFAFDPMNLAPTRSQLVIDDDSVPDAAPMNDVKSAVSRLALSPKNQPQQINQSGHPVNNVNSFHSFNS
jgi:hypothetical protein